MPRAPEDDRPFYGETDTWGSHESYTKREQPEGRAEFERQHGGRTLKYRNAPRPRPPAPQGIPMSSLPPGGTFKA